MAKEMYEMNVRMQYEIRQVIEGLKFPLGTSTNSAQVFRLLGKTHEKSLRGEATY